MSSTHRPLLIPRRRIAPIRDEVQAAAWLRRLDAVPASTVAHRRMCRALARGDLVLLLPDALAALDPPASVAIPHLTDGR